MKRNRSDDVDVEAEEEEHQGVESVEHHSGDVRQPIPLHSKHAEKGEDAGDGRTQHEGDDLEDQRDVRGCRARRSCGPGCQ